jgi:transposase
LVAFFAQPLDDPVRNIVSRLDRLAEAHWLRQLLAAESDPRVQKRLMVIILTLRGTLSAVGIAFRVGLARSTVFSYRRLFADQGVNGLLAHTRPGRPATPVTPALEQVIVKGLRLLSWFNVPAVQKWIGHHDRVYPDWIVRRWAHAYINRLRIKFMKDWRTERVRSYRAWRESLDPLNNPYIRWRRRRATASTEPALGLVVGDSAGLLPWTVAH